MKIALLIIILFSTKVYSQIRLPKEFKVKPTQTYAQNVFSDGLYTFSSYPYAHDGYELNDIITNADRFFNKTPIKTMDSLYIWSGKLDNLYYYTILLPESLFEFQVFSSKNDELFSYYSIWLLEQVREKRNFPSDYINGNLYFIEN